MDYNRTAAFEDFGRLRPFKFELVPTLDALNCKIARAAAAAIKAAAKANCELLLILPGGPLDYGHRARLCNTENISCAPLCDLAPATGESDHG